MAASDMNFYIYHNGYFTLPLLLMFGLFAEAKFVVVTHVSTFIISVNCGILMLMMQYYVQLYATNCADK